MTPLERLVDHLDRATGASGICPVEPKDRLVVAFSGGPDSTALLAALAVVARRRDFGVVAAHLDHGFDADSPRRALEARRLAVTLLGDDRVPGIAGPSGDPNAEPSAGLNAGLNALVVERRPVRTGAGESLEAAGRRVRYRFLEEVRRRHGARWILTAHHRDDQAETVLLRLLQGSGLDGLAAIQPRRGRLARPLLDLDRSLLARAAREALGAVGAGTEPVDDPANRDPHFARPAVRQRLLPRLEAAEPGVARRLAHLAGAARGARRRLDAVLTRHLDLRTAGSPPEATSSGDGAPAGALLHWSRPRFVALPGPLVEPALALAARRAGARPPGAAARHEILRQRERPEPACDLGEGWRLTGTGGRLGLVPPTTGPRPPKPSPFSYTLERPGIVRVPELALRVSIERCPLAAWMWRGRPDRAAFVLPDDPSKGLVVRTRRPGDTLRPLGAPGRRKLKDVLIDAGVARERRDRLALLCWSEHSAADTIVWVPGVTIDHRFRLPDLAPPDGSDPEPAAPSRRVWVARLLPATETSETSETDDSLRPPAPQPQPTETPR